MEEYRIIRGNDSDVQMKLNQWRHMYKLTIISMQNDGYSEDSNYEGVVILLRRKRKD